MHGFTPGANVDITARIIAEHLGKRLGQAVVVETRPGAGGTISAAAVARAAPDGSTLAILPSGHAVSAAIYKQLSYNAVDDFSFISMLTENPFILVTYPDHPAKTVADVIKSAQADPGKLTYATAGNGTGMHLASELLVVDGRDEDSARSLSRLAAGDHRFDRQARRLPDGHAAAPAAVPERRAGARDRRDRDRRASSRCPMCRRSAERACRAIR